MVRKEGALAAGLEPRLMRMPEAAALVEVLGYSPHPTKPVQQVKSML